MPIVTISHKETAPPMELAKTLEALPEIVSRAVECSEEPYDGTLKPGDVNMIVTASLAPSEDLDYVIEVKTRRTDSRLGNLDERAEEIRSALEALGLQAFGVWLELHDASWAQTVYRTASL